MKLLLDTPILPWACAAPSSLPAEAVALIKDRGNDLLFSASSIWDVGIKNAMGKPGYRFDPAVLRRALLDANYQELVMIGQHASRRRCFLPAQRPLRPDAHRPSPDGRLCPGDERSGNSPLCSAHPARSLAIQVVIEEAMHYRVEALSGPHRALT